MDPNDMNAVALVAAKAANMAVAGHEKAKHEEGYRLPSENPVAGQDGAKAGIFEESPGAESMGRVIAFVGAVLGGALAAAGGVLAFVEVLSKSGTSAGIALAGIGVGMFTGGALGKAWGKQAEARVEAAEAGRGEP